MTKFFRLMHVYHYGFVALTILVLASLQGCINIKAHTPTYHYYTLESTPANIREYECHTFSTMGLELEIPPYLNTQHITLTSPQARVTPLTTIKWLSLPSLLIQNTLESNAKSHCIVLSTLGAHAWRLRITVRALTIYQETKQAVVSLDYALLQGQEIRKIRTLASMQNIQDSSEQSMINAIQHALDSTMDKIQGALCDDTKLCKPPKTISR